MRYSARLSPSVMRFERQRAAWRCVRVPSAGWSQAHRACQRTVSGQKYRMGMQKNTWPRDLSTGPGGGLSTGPGGGMSTGPGGGASTGPGGGLSTGPGGGMSTGPGGGLSTGPGGGLSTGPGGGLSTGPGGGLSTGPGGGLSTGPGGGLCTGPSKHPYRSNRPPLPHFLAHLRSNGYGQYADLIESYVKDRI
jgi:hypothetical protein